MIFEEMEMIMRAELESDVRRLEVHMTLCSIRIETAFYQNEDVTNESDSLNWLVRIINQLSPQYPEGLSSEENEIQFLRDAVIGREWLARRSPKLRLRITRSTDSCRHFVKVCNVPKNIFAKNHYCYPL